MAATTRSRRWSKLEVPQILQICHLAGTVPETSRALPGNILLFRGQTEKNKRKVLQKLVCSCLVLAAEVDGSEIDTIEGMANGNKLHPLQKKFLEHAALQCGICTPGILVAAKALLEKNLNPTEKEVRYWLAGNLCRCTGYDKIIRAVMDAAFEMRNENGSNYT